MRFNFCRNILLGLLISGNAFSQEMSLENIFDIELEVATRTKKSFKEAPSVVSVITREDIEAAHANDLVDVLQMVPGFNIAKDVDDPAIMMRGLFGFEGRTLVMIDGMQVSGLYFGSMTLGNRIPANMIERVEIIRGPGSVVYGGIAELATINIITLTNDKSLKDNRVDLKLSNLSGKFGQKDLGLSYGAKPSQWSYQGYFFAGEAMRSNAESVFYSLRPSVEHDRESALVQNLLKVGSIKSEENFELKYVFNRYTDHFLGDFTNLNNRNSSEVSALHEVYSFDLSKKINIGEKHTWTPSLTYLRTRDWEQAKRTDPLITRYKLLNLFMKETELWNFTYGFEYAIDHGSLEKDPQEPASHSRGFSKKKGDSLSDTVDVYNYALFFNLSFAAMDSNWSLGARYDNNEIFGSALSPRLAITKLMGPRYFKLLYSEAFRAPLMGNNAYSKYGFNPDANFREEVKPEKSRVIEFEMGHQWNDNWAFSYNIFDQSIKDVIEFYYCSNCDEPDDMGVDTNGDLYSKNGDKIGTRGIEAELKFKDKALSSNFNLSYFHLTEKGAITYLTPGDKKDLMGAPNLKIYNNNSFQFSEKTKGQLGFVYLGAKNSMAKQYSSGTNDNSATEKKKAQFFVNCGLQYEYKKDLNLRLSIHDLFNQSLRLVTPYVDGGKDDFQYKGREIIVQANYRF